MVWLNSLHVIRAHQGALAFCGPVSSIAEHSHAPSCIAEQTAFIPYDHRVLITDLFYNCPVAPASHSPRVGLPPSLYLLQRRAYELASTSTS